MICARKGVLFLYLRAIEYAIKKEISAKLIFARGVV